MSAASRRPFALSAHVVCCRRAYFSLPPTLQNLRIENRLLRRENLSGYECKLARIRTPFPINNNVTRLASLLIRAELKDFSLNMIFLANYVQSFHKTHYVCLFIKEKKNTQCVSLRFFRTPSAQTTNRGSPPRQINLLREIYEPLPHPVRLPHLAHRRSRFVLRHA